MARAAAAAQPQTTLYETVIDDGELESALEARERLRVKKGEITKEFKSADEVAKAKINELDLGLDANVRIGRFVVGLRKIEGGVVTFEKNPSTRLRIGVLPED